MFKVFKVFKCSRVMTFRKIKRVTKEGPKNGKISGGVKPGHLQEGGPATLHCQDSLGT